MNKKSVLEQALLQIETLEEAVKANAKGIISSTMKNELNELLEQIEDKSEEEEIIPENPEDVTEESADEETDKETIDSEEEEDVEDVKNAEDTDSIEGLDDVDDKGLEDTDSIDDTENMEDSKEDDDMEDDDMEDDEDIEDKEDEPVLDLTNATDGEVIKVFKAMKDEDGIVVKKDGNTIELQDGDSDYVIKLDKLTEGIFDEFKKGYNEESPEGEEDVYEIVLDEDDDMDFSGNEEDIEISNEETPEEEFSEAARTKWNPHGDKTPGVKRSGLPSKKMFKAGSGQINEEFEKLKKQNVEYKKAVKLFKEKLNEIAVFNANLAFATRLFTEHTTTKQEKLDILKRFDNINTITESKTLYSSISKELLNNNTVKESFTEKITSSPKSSSTEILAESKTYENPQFKRMKELMKTLK